MTGYVVLLIVSLIGLAMSWFRFQAGRSRRETTARLAAESDGGVISPTEELFRAEGVPIPDAMRHGLSTAPPPPTQKLGPMLQAAAQTARSSLGQVRTTVAPLLERSDLDALVAGVQLPCDLAPLPGDEPGPDGGVTFVTSVDQRDELRDELHTAFARIGCSVRWSDDDSATIRRGPYAGELTIGPVADRAELVGVTIRSL